MVTFFEANQARLGLKMKLSMYSWFNSSSIIAEKDGYTIIVGVSAINNYVRKIVPQVYNGISVKTEAI